MNKLRFLIIFLFLLLIYNCKNSNDLISIDNLLKTEYNLINIKNFNQNNITQIRFIKDKNDIVYVLLIESKDTVISEWYNLNSNALKSFNKVEDITIIKYNNMNTQDGKNCEITISKDFTFLSIRGIKVLNIPN